MLNYNKIHSSINHDRTSKRSLASYIGIGESTFRSRLEKKNLTPDDVEKIADYFGKPIAYYFDRNDQDLAQDNKSSDPKVSYGRNPEVRIKQLEERMLKLEEDLNEINLYFKLKKKLKELEKSINSSPDSGR